MSRTSIRMLGVAVIGLMFAVVVGQVSRSTAEVRPVPKEQFHRVPYKNQGKTAFVIKGAFTSTNGGTVSVGAAPGHTGNPWTIRSFALSGKNNLIIYVKAEQVIEGTTRPAVMPSLAGTGQILVTTSDPVTSTTIDVEEVDIDPCGS